MSSCTYKVCDRVYRSTITDKNVSQWKLDEKNLNSFLLKSTGQKQTLILNFSDFSFDARIVGNVFYTHTDHVEDIAYLCHLSCKIQKWLAGGEMRQILIHCPQNLEYVGLILSCYKLFSGDYSLSQEKHKGAFPSIWRYKKLFYHVLKSPLTNLQCLNCFKISLNDYTPVKPKISIKQSNVVKWSCDKGWKKDNTQEYSIGVENCTLIGDFILNYFEGETQLFRFTFNTTMIPEKTSFLRIKRDQLDILGGKSLPETFSIKVWFSQGELDLKYKTDIEELFSKSPQFVKRREIENQNTNLTQAPSTSYAFFGTNIIDELKKKFFKTQVKEVKEPEKKSSPKRKREVDEETPLKELKVEQVEILAPIAPMMVFNMPPPPPPMIMTGGAPPPPPPGVPALNLTPLKQKIDQKKSNIKSLHWTPLSGTSENSFWSSIEPSDSKIDAMQLETLFSSKPTTPRGTPQKGLLSPRKTDPVLVEMNRARQIEILLRQYKCMENPVVEIAKCIQEMNIEELSLEKLNGIMIMAPTPEEIEKLKCTKLEEPVVVDQLILAISNVPRFREKLKTMHAMMYIQRIDEFDPTRHINAKRDGLEELQGCKKLSKVLEMILVIGNIMNSGKRTGNAKGFKLSILPGLSETKAVDGKSTLMDFVVECAKKDNLSDFYIDLEGLENGSKVTIEEIEMEVRKIREVKDLLVQESTGCDHEMLYQMMTIAEEISNDLATDLADLKDTYERTLDYFGESSQKDADFFQTWKTFVSQWKHALGK